MQKWLAQSVASTHFLPVAQGTHVVPPQSTSVSPPFIWQSPQLPATHVCCQHRGVAPLHGLIMSPADVHVVCVPLHCMQVRSALGMGGSHAPITAGGMNTQAIPAAMVLLLSAPFTHAYAIHWLPLWYTSASSMTLVIAPFASQWFLWQLPYACDGASPAM
jgi:hypothetical protein